MPTVDGLTVVSGIRTWSGRRVSQDGPRPLPSVIRRSTGQPISQPIFGRSFDVVETGARTGWRRWNGHESNSELHRRPDRSERHSPSSQSHASDNNALWEENRDFTRSEWRPDAILGIVASIP